MNGMLYALCLFITGQGVCELVWYTTGTRVSVQIGAIYIAVVWHEERGVRGAVIVLLSLSRSAASSSHSNILRRVKSMRVHKLQTAK